MAHLHWMYSCFFLKQCSHNLRKFSWIWGVSIGMVLVITRILCNLFKCLLLSHSQPLFPYRNEDMEISYESFGPKFVNYKYQPYMCYTWLRANSRSTMLNNIVDNIEQCGQHNIVQGCFHHLWTGCAFCCVDSVYTMPVEKKLRFAKTLYNHY